MPQVRELAGRVWDRVQQEVAARVLRLPDAAVRRMVRRPVELDGRRLDARVQLALGLLAAARRVPIEQLAVPAARAELERMPAVFDGPRVAVPMQDWGVPGPAGEITVRIYGGRAGRPGPGLVWYHGGGGVIGSLDTHDGVCRLLAEQTGARVISIDYRLGPEHPFPAAVDDAVAAFRGIRDRAERLGLDPRRIAVGGDSMGGNLVAAVARSTRDDASGGPRFQLVVYPVTDMGETTRSRRLFAEGFFLTCAAIEWFEAHYLCGADPHDPRASPLRAEDLSGQCPAYVATAGFDPLRDEGIAYAERLRDAGVAVEARCFDDQVHGFVQMTGIPSARAACLELATAVRRALAD